MKLKAIIIEDEPLARDLIKNYLANENDIDLIGEFDNGFSGLKAINELKPDLVFLDVQMPKLTGIELLELLDEFPKIIFTTAYDEYAIKAFELNAVDYLLKPFSKERFSQSLNKVREKSSDISELKKHVSETKQLDKIVVKSNDKINIIPLNEILYFEAQDDYVMIYTKTGKFLKYETMKYLEEHLDKSKFIRIHRSYIINVNELQKIEKFGKDNYQVILSGNINLSVSRSRYQHLKQFLNL
ncbi:MAG: LytTR family transcriptional regulator DNA-binding domain-containing protein [Flavobacteriales bacterium]|nr:LytTR family transcriptional regulator DNA-binding domain-containing protein [Flavobacteriales bacterium]MCB9363599.1 LytTR family transcriptional regulator DNA-binding domain-containing protein [Flavobacteriales bacterium]